MFIYIFVKKLILSQEISKLQDFTVPLPKKDHTAIMDKNSGENW